MDAIGVTQFVFLKTIKNQVIQTVYKILSDFFCDQKNLGKHIHFPGDSNCEFQTQKKTRNSKMSTLSIFLKNTKGNSLYIP